MNNKTILIVEDEVELSEILSEYLISAGFSTQIMNTGKGIIDYLKENTPALILLDLMLPEVDGLTLCREIRAFSDVPIIMQTAKVEEVDRLIGLEIGADDYLCKPYSPREMVARVKVILRRINQPQQQLESDKADGLTINESTLTVVYQGQTIELTKVEFHLFSLMFNQAGVIFSRQRMMEGMYDDYRIVSERTVDSHIKKLRKKIEKITNGEKLIHSIYGSGYKYEPIAR